MANVITEEGIMAGDDEASETVAVRMPKGERAALNAAANIRGVTVTAFVRDAIRTAVHGRHGATPPAFTDDYREFMKSVGDGDVLILVEHPITLARTYYRGRVHDDTPTILLLSSTIGGAVILKRDIAGWYSNTDNMKMFAMIHALQQTGWNAQQRF